MVKLLKKEAPGIGLIQDLKKLSSRTNQKEKRKLRREKKRNERERPAVYDAYVATGVTE